MAPLGEKKSSAQDQPAKNEVMVTRHTSTKEETTDAIGLKAAASEKSGPTTSSKTNTRRRKRNRNRARKNKAANTAHHEKHDATAGAPEVSNHNENDTKPLKRQHTPNAAAGKHKSAGAKPEQHQRSGQSRRPAHAHGGHQSAHQPLYAALDLGTNNCRLLVARPTKAGQFQVVDAFSRIVRLGEGLGRHGELSQDAMDRAVGALKICASKLSRHRIKNYRLIATEACRQAANGQAFLERVKRDTGLNLEMINRETEARLAVSGCASLVGRHTNSVILFDIGGGSSEIAAIQFDGKRTARLANHITAWTSLPVGVVTLSERHGGHDVTPAIFDQMVAEVDDLLDRTAPESLLGFEPDIENFHLLGTSGTVTTLAGLHLNLARYDRRKVDGLWLQNNDVDNMLNKLLSWDLKTRSENPCIGPDRSDLVLAGCAIMQSIRKRWPSKRMRVADRGLREGLLNDMMAKDGVWRRRRRRRHAKPKPLSHSGEAPRS